MASRRSVCLPTPFVKHYMKRDDGALPTVAAIATAPIVLADGELLAPDGLDRERGIQFIIPDELRAIIPKAEDCTPDAVKAAMEFLCNEWLVDVATDHIGKAIGIALALTLIERSLLDQRPCFRVTAGRRGSGKTTLIIMLVLAVTGTRPAAAAWSSDENERRKSLFAYLLAGVPGIVWDNIPRGTKIACPHIERSCTTELYADRVLGVSEMLTTSASTINIFTGNNIETKGDLASRDLHIRLNVDCVDPENRDFKHPDPIGWTERPSRRDSARALHHPAGQPAAQGGARCAGQDQIQDVVATGRVGGRACSRTDRAEARLQRPVHRAGGGRRGVGIARRRARYPGEEMAEGFCAARPGKDGQ